MFSISLPLHVPFLFFVTSLNSETFFRNFTFWTSVSLTNFFPSREKLPQASLIRQQIPFTPTHPSTHHLPNMTSHPDLTKFKALSFDCYGTLIDWESGLRAGLQPIISRLPPPPPPSSTNTNNNTSSSFATNPPPTEVSLTKRFDTLSAALQSSSPTLRYDLNLSSSFLALAAELGVHVTEEEATAFGSLPGTWIPFEDTIPGLDILKRHYKLIILSNIDASNISRTLTHFSPVEFDAVYTAEQIGSYKPADGNFTYLFEHVKQDFGVQWDDERGEGLLHVARSLTADHVPAKRFGLRSVWISRGGDVKDGEGVGGDWEGTKGDVGFEWRFDTVGEFAREVERQFGEKR